MKKLILILIFSILTFANTLPKDSVVQVFTAFSEPNYLEPWKDSAIIKYTGSGVIIKDNHILTAAHVVSNGKFIEVQKENSSKR